VRHPRSAPNATQEQTGGCYRGSALARLALLESMSQGASDFVPPAAQRKAVSRTEEPGPKADIPPYYPVMIDRRGRQIVSDRHAIDAASAAL